MEISAHPFFENITPQMAQPLVDASQIVQLADKALIFDEGDPADNLYLILRGKVAFQKRLPSGEWLTVSYSQEGDYFGEIGVLTDDPRSLRAIADGDLHLLLMPGNILVQYLSQMPGPVEDLLQSVIKHLHDTTRHYIQDMLHQERMAIVGRMTNTIIHDFKNPFCLISLSSQLILQKHPDPETARLCTNIENQVQRMLEMVSELSAFSRGKHTLKRTRFLISDLLAEFQDLNFPYFEDELITIVLDVPDVELNADRGKLQRVLQNLIDNAMEAMADEGGLIEISGQIDTVNSMLELRVRDTGCGIPEEIRETFFEPFVTHGKSEGTGLGSAITKSIIEAHGGRIRFESTRGEGTTFFISLPLG
ncbi:MAG: ATP-binding protein [Verrucomicrobiota bacterium JB022]|nr:ATP-binding protein [Verrucomicrobiota bacterium JB022]